MKNLVLIFILLNFIGCGKKDSGQNLGPQNSAVKTDRIVTYLIRENSSGMFKALYTSEPFIELLRTDEEVYKHYSDGVQIFIVDSDEFSWDYLSIDTLINEQYEALYRCDKNSISHLHCYSPIARWGHGWSELSEQEKCEIDLNNFEECK